METGLEIAIIGMAARLPGAKNIRELWHNLVKGVESIFFISDEELEESGVAPEDIENSNYIKAKGVLEGIEYFDAFFFDYSPRMADMMHPQVRIFHECAYNALEDAGYDPLSYRGLIGVYGGAFNSYSWQNLLLAAGKGDLYRYMDEELVSGKDILTTRVSHRLNLRGPSISVNTQCSTSLVAFHLACQGLLSWECDMALAGASSIVLPPKAGYLYQDTLVLAPDGHCKPFAASANGTVPADGVAVVVLKRLQEALEDGDHIYAIYKGSAVNNDGKEKSDFAGFSVEGQAAVIRGALRMAEVEAESISYIEAHGTGTFIGDPIEIEGLKRAFNTSKKGFCKIGSIKSNMGHLYMTAGIAGLIKTVLALTHRLIPPTLNMDEPNPTIDFENSPFVLQTELGEWKNDKYPLRTGVSSFGMGGTNVFVILEEAPKGEEFPEDQGRKSKIIALSAKTESALERNTANLREFFIQNPCIHLADAAYTLHRGRRAFPYRRFLVGKRMEEVVEGLGSPGAGKMKSFFAPVENRALILMFPGGGAPYVNMALGIYQSEPVFREEMDRCFELLKPLMGYDIKEILYSPGSNSDEFGQKEMALPVIFTVEYALAKLLMHWGVNPYAMIGHSAGEYTAAALSGVFSLEEALGVVAARAKLPQQMSPDPTTGEQESAFAEVMRNTRWNKPGLPYISNVTGNWITVEEATDPEYWVKQPYQTPRFDEGLTKLLEIKNAVFVEVGPGKTLSAFTDKHKDKKDPHLVTHLLRPPHEEVDDSDFLLNELGQLWAWGVKIDWSAFYRGEKRRRLSLPGYSFDKKRYWTDRKPFKITMEMVNAQPAVTRKQDLAEWFDIPSRRPSVLAADGKAEETSPSPVNWLLFCDEEGLGERLADKLKEIGGEEIRVVAVSTKDLRALTGFVKTMKIEEASLVETNDEAAAPTVSYHRPQLSTSYTAPRTKTEEILAALWQEHLGFKQIGVQDDFFELGGDSLTAVKLLNKIQKSFQFKISIRDIFLHTTIEKIAGLIDSQEGGSGYKPIPLAEEKEYYPLAPVQKGIYLPQQLYLSTTSYNHQYRVEIGMELDKERLEVTFREMVKRYEIFRTSFREVNGKPVQHIMPAGEVKVEVVVYEVEDGDRSYLEIMKAFVRSFDLAQPPLFRVGMVKTGKPRGLVLIDIHHIIMDGFSMARMIREVAALYQGETLHVPKLQYKDYSEWKNSREERARVKEQEKYWLKEFSGARPVMAMPIDNPRPHLPEFEGKTRTFLVGKGETRKLKQLAKEEGVTLYAAIFAVFNIYMSRICSQEDIIVGTIAVGRDHPDLEPLMGMLVNTLPIRNFPASEKTFTGFLKEVQDRTVAAFENQSYPFEDLVQKILVTRDRSRHPLFDVMFYFELESQYGGDKSLMNILYGFDNPTAKFDQNVFVKETPGGLEINLEYRTKLFKEETIDRFFRYFLDIIAAVTGNKNIKLKDIKLSHGLVAASPGELQADFSFQVS